MMSIKMNNVLVLAVALGSLGSSSRGIEVIENYYKGEKYEPEGRSIEEQYPYSSSHIAAASAGDYTLPQMGQDGATLEGRKMGDDGYSFPYANLLRQLGTVLHRTLVGNQYTLENQDSAARNIEEADVDTEDAPEAKQQAAGDNLHYHFYPHNQHLFKLPECATQQAVTVIKTCEPVWSVRDCRVPRDWSILALQNTRTGKAHYLVICKCPDSAQLDGPLNHDQPTYAQVPGIRVYGMMCVRSHSYGRGRRMIDDGSSPSSFPWDRVTEALKDKRVLQDLTDDEQYTGPHLLQHH